MKRSFTLLELLIVIVIIGILAAIVLPQYQNLVAKARATEAKRALDALSRAQYEYFIETNKFYNGGGAAGEYADFSGLSVKPPVSKNWLYYTVHNWDKTFGGIGQGLNSYGVVWAVPQFPVADGECMDYIIAYVDGNAPEGSDGATPPGPITRKYYYWIKGENSWREGWEETTN